MLYELISIYINEIVKEYVYIILDIGYLPVKEEAVIGMKLHGRSCRAILLGLTVTLHSATSASSLLRMVHTSDR